MTTRLAGQDTAFLPFNQGSNGPGVDGGEGNPINPAGPRTAYLWQRVWQRDAWLGLLGSFVHVEEVRDENGKKTGRTRTVFPRYHQWDAVTGLLAAAREEGPGHNKFVQHSAGSGKSNTIAWLAHGLSRLHTPGDLAALGDGARAAGLAPNAPVFDKVIIVTDRKVLDRQLQDTVAGFDHTPGMIVKVDEDSRQLRAALEGKQARVIITTLQKFPIVAQGATDLAGTRFAVIIDEAHSSQSGEAAKDLKSVLTGLSGDAALAAAEGADSATEAGAPDVEDVLADSVAARGRQPNLSFFAFAATPKHKTLSLFGEPGRDGSGTERYAPFHLYSMRQAIEEGFILDVLASYTTYKTYYRLANRLGEDDPEVPASAATTLARWVSLHPTNIAQRAHVIVEHFRRHTSTKIGGRAKAMVVTSSRLHAVRYHQAIQKAIADKGYHRGPSPMRALVAFSGTLDDPDAPGVTYREAAMNGFGEAQLLGRFAGPEYGLLVVADKYQTGFDQPLLHTMYVAKRLADVRAVQTLSRLNRTHPGKTDTFVLDFVNTAEDITEAFRPYFARTTAAPTDPNLLFNLQRRVLDAGVIDPAELTAGVRALLLDGAAGTGRLNASIDPAVQRWRALDDDAEREDLRTALRDFTRAYAFLGQIVAFRDTELEALHYYGKYLLARLPRADGAAAVDLDGAAVLTHLVAAQQNASLGDDAADDAAGADPLTGPGEGRGRQHDEPTDTLSALIAALNERFGLDLDEGDRIWFEQQEAHLREHDDVRQVALNNDFEQFKVYLEPQLEGGVIDRQQQNGALFEAFFDKPEFRAAMHDWITERLYRNIRSV